MSVESVAYDALNLAKQNARDIEHHEDICAERYQGINNAIREIKGWMKWAGTSAFTIVIGMLGFLIVQQFHDNTKVQDNAQAKIDQLQRQLADERAARVGR